MAKLIQYKRCADCGGLISYPSFGTDKFCWSFKCSPDRHGRINPPVALRQDDPMESDSENLRNDVYG